MFLENFDDLDNTTYCCNCGNMILKGDKIVLWKSGEVDEDGEETALWFCTNTCKEHYFSNPYADNNSQLTFYKLINMN
jgi:hypothetical protein